MVPISEGFGQQYFKYNHVEQKSKHLPQSYLVHLLPLYKRLSIDDLLQRCIAGLRKTKTKHSMLRFGGAVQKSEHLVLQQLGGSLA